jgi:outer membrane biosynthesis protein TonB
VGLLVGASRDGGGASSHHSRSAGSLEGKRKIIVQIRPAPTPLARRLNLSGTVRLRVTVSPAGDAIRTEEPGGSPLLVKAATDGVSKAKWEAAPLQTKEIIEITFPPNPL